jgi:6-phosphogluconolactonase
MAFHHNQKVLFVANELDSTVSACHWDSSTGSLVLFQTLSTLPDGWNGTSYVADIHLDSSGKYLYVSNRGHHSLACYQASEEGLLAPIGFTATGGDWPRNFAVLPAYPTHSSTGDLVLAANERSDNVVAFRIPPENGIPVPTGHEYKVPKPVCVLPAEI